MFFMFFSNKSVNKISELKQTLPEPEVGLLEKNSVDHEDSKKINIDKMLLNDKKDLNENKTPQKNSATTQEKDIKKQREERFNELKSPFLDGLKIKGGRRLQKPTNGRISTLESGPTYFIVFGLNNLEDNQFLMPQQDEYLGQLSSEYKQKRKEFRTRPNITLEELESEIEKLTEQYEYLFLAELTLEQQTFLKKHIDTLFEGTYDLWELQMKKNKNKTSDWYLGTFRGTE